MPRNPGDGVSCFAARCCVVWPCVAQQRDPSWRTIFHCHAANSEQKRTGKLRHSATLPCSVGRTREEKKKHKRQRWRDSVRIIPRFGKREEGGDATWSLTILSYHISRPQAYVQDLVAQTIWRKLWKMGWKEAGASWVRIDVLFSQHSWNSKNIPSLHRLLFLNTCLGKQFLWLNNFKNLHDLHKLQIAFRGYDLEMTFKRSSTT